MTLEILPRARPHFRHVRRVHRGGAGFWPPPYDMYREPYVIALDRMDRAAPTLPYRVEAVVVGSVPFKAYGRTAAEALANAKSLKIAVAFKFKVVYAVLQHWDGRAWSPLVKLDLKTLEPLLS